MREHQTGGAGEHLAAFALAVLFAPLLLSVLFATVSHALAVLAQTLATTVIIVLVLVTVLRIQFALAGALFVTIDLEHLEEKGEE